jgi:hypothetical protein
LASEGRKGRGHLTDRRVDIRLSAPAPADPEDEVHHRDSAVQVQVQTACLLQARCGASRHIQAWMGSRLVPLEVMAVLRRRRAECWTCLMLLAGAEGHRRVKSRGKGREDQERRRGLRGGRKTLCGRGAAVWN